MHERKEFVNEVVVPSNDIEFPGTAVQRSGRSNLHLTAPNDGGKEKKEKGAT